MTKRLFATLIAVCLILGAACAAGEDIVIPDITPGEFDIPDNEAMAFLRRMGIGWNLGNTFDATANGNPRDDLAIERSWVGVYTTQEMIQAVADAGFGFIRIPISWHNHIDSAFTINEPFLDRIQTVVDWCMEADLCAIINIHHDVGDRWYYPDKAHEETSRRYVERIWTQVAARFADYDERLIFENLNEPRLMGTQYEWYFNPVTIECKESAEVINGLNQLYVDTVRSTGGENADRYLMVSAYDASPDTATNEYFTLPADSADNRLIISAHAYSPYDFALNRNGTAAYDMNSQTDRQGVVLPIRKLYNTWISRGVPVVIGEFGAVDKNNLQARVDWAAVYVSTAAMWNIPVCLWDNHAFRSGGENFGFLNRRTCAWEYPDLLETMMRYSLKEYAYAE
ncbi:MAG: glycoside hydrolase family 5 protein [Clostridia bacterium]|nr:glycoside hydrolase family 5 protein [Clostridia bacterium]